MFKVQLYDKKYFYFILGISFCAPLSWGPFVGSSLKPEPSSDQTKARNVNDKNKPNERKRIKQR
jgi:hypothetical protein